MSKDYDWKQTTLNNVTDIIGDGLHGTPNYSETGKYYFINGRNLNGKVIIDDKTKRVSEEEYQKYKKDLNSRTIFLSINGTLGRTAKYYGEDLVLGKSACYLNIKKDVNKDFIYYLLETPNFIHYADTYSTGTTIKNLGLKAIREYSFKLPPIKVQHEIATVISLFDNKIENNNAIIANLEEQAQTIFKSWFVDFEPFQDSDFIKSELGELPEKWGIAKLSNLFEIKYGKNLPTKKLEEEGFPVFGGNGQIGYYHEYLFKEPKLLISCRGAASGKVLVSLPNSFITNNSLVMNEFNRDYFHYFKYLFNTIEFENYATGSAQPQITISNIKDIKVVVPTEDIIKKFNKLLNPFFTLQLNLKKENIRLEETRDTLLPKLMSGEIRVEEATEVN